MTLTTTEARSFAVPVVLLDTNVGVSAFINPHGFPARLTSLLFTAELLSAAIYLLPKKKLIGTNKPGRPPEFLRVLTSSYFS